MNSNQYLLHIRNRPQRIAFLVNPSKNFDKRFDTIIRYNQTKWGGRFNPIILSNGETIENGWWDTLYRYDPDVIKSFTPLKSELIERIQNFLSPYSIEIVRESEKQWGNYPLHISNEGLAVLPTPENIASVSQALIGDSRLVLFDIKAKKNDKIYQFILRNFGTITLTMYTNAILEQIEKKAFHIESKEDIASALLQMRPSTQDTCPIQLCSLPNSFPDIENSANSENFTVIIGNTPEDLAYFWNRNLFVPKWSRKRLNQMWIPEEFIDDLEEPLKKWFQRMDDARMAARQTLNFTSFSLSKSKLERISGKLLKNTYLRKFIHTPKEIQIPNYQAENPYQGLNEDLQLLTLVREEMKFSIDNPFKDQSNLGKYWMVDVYIQESKAQGKHTWWKLPQKNKLSHLLFPNRPSRIRQNHYPSALMKYGNSILHIKLPTTSAIFNTLFTQENIPCYINDPRSKLKLNPYKSIFPSDKGQYLSGLLELFSGLDNAFGFFQEKYWREMFRRLSKCKISKENEINSAIANKLAKMIRGLGTDFHEDNKKLESLTEYVIQLSKEIRVGKELSYEAFWQEAKAQLTEIKEMNHDFSYTEEQLDNILMSQIQSLLEQNVLFIGIRSHCPFCCNPNWFHIDETSQVLQCKGCGNRYPIKPQENWFYKLNTLAQICIQQNQIPIILSLGQLSHESSESFFLCTSSELYDEKKPSAAPKRELDIICIKGGHFIIGEVKKSAKGFTDSHFDDIAEVAERIRPDKIIFSSLEGKLNKKNKDKLENLKKRMANLGIEVQWYNLHRFMFDPSLP